MSGDTYLFVFSVNHQTGCSHPVLIIDQYYRKPGVCGQTGNASGMSIPRTGITVIAVIIIRVIPAIGVLLWTGILCFVYFPESGI
ncbi:hypothetical protein GM31_22840 [Trabulsiella odontotermitis]|uniref:Uncharacterized protein n=1 Tax=Trabulsiella odontotermitis TaxID=379893 RepID=A0A0L0GV21_9ENTR|nr:hypothetical protein GM31_22840 [Trabulsiella odontotermitis]